MFTKNKNIIFLIISLIIFGSGASCGGGQPVEENGEETEIIEEEEINLTMWGVFDDSAIIKPLIDEFNEENPNIKISYSKKDYVDYEDLLVDAIASEEGPDIFTIHNDWLPKHRAKMSPMTDDVFTLEEYSQTFVDSAYEDFVADNKIYAIPLYTDNLALIYNKRMFTDNQIYEEPETWDEIIQYSKILTKTVPGNPNNITTSGIALGTADNIVRSNDVLLALMMQTGTPIISDDKRSFNFNQFRKNPDGSPYYPGTSALEFYTSFSNTGKQSYSWNSSFENNISAFANGRTAMIAGYSYFIPMIEKMNPTISIGTTRFPQIKGSSSYITLTNYWAWGVSRSSEKKEAAWKFLKFLVTDDYTHDTYLNSVDKPSAIRNAMGDVFDEQANKAGTLYKGDSEEFDKIITEMINNVVKYNQSPQIAIDTAAREANEMLKKNY